MELSRTVRRLYNRSAGILKKREVMMKKFTIIFLLTILLVFTARCFADGEPAVFTRDGVKLSIPAEYADKLVVETPEVKDLFSVSEKASLDAAKAENVTWQGVGWLFSIGRITEKELQEMLCSDMSGAMVFAKDANDVYYMFYHPTDVRLYRANNDYSEKELQAWGELNEWAYSVRDSFIKENGLTAVHRGNTMLDIDLARMVYMDDVDYTITALKYGTVEPNGVKAADYIEPLVTAARITMDRDAKVPNGEYMSLYFPQEDVRYDFFLEENLIREVWSQGKNVMMYRVEFDDETLRSASLLNDLYLDMVLAESLGYTADDFVGIWYEKIAGRGCIEISKGETEGTYKVLINWGSSAAESSAWTMTANGTGAVLRYEDGERVDIVFTSEDSSTETVAYNNGKGNFRLLSTYELVWDDETEHAADDTVFVKN